MSALPRSLISFFFFFNDTATTEIYTLSLHDALPIYFEIRNWPVTSGVSFTPSDMDAATKVVLLGQTVVERLYGTGADAVGQDRKSTRLNSSHLVISYAVFCLKKKKKTKSDSSRDIGS